MSHYPLSAADKSLGNVLF